MKKTWVVVFVIILALHLGALCLFLSFQKKDEALEPAPDGPSVPPTLVPEPTLSQSGKTPRSVDKRSGSSTSTRGNSKSYSKPPTVKPHAGSSGGALAATGGGVVKTGRFRSYDYSNAVKGDIPGIHESRNATAGILVDPANGKVLWCKNPKKAVPIASMTKMMTALLAIEAVRSEQISMSDPVRVTKAAARIGGSDIWLDPRETFPFGDLLKAMMVKSANDAAYLVAQRLGEGSSTAFVAKMNARAKRLGMKNARFHNPHGLPEKKLGENSDSPEELAFLASVLMKYPEILKLTSTKIDYVDRKIGKNKRTQLVNTNRLVRTGCRGVDGMKTGFTKKSGFCITVTCERNGRRLIAVMTGFSTSKERGRFARKLLDWGYKR